MICNYAVQGAYGVSAIDKWKTCQQVHVLDDLTCSTRYHMMFYLTNEDKSLYLKSALYLDVFDSGHSVSQLLFHFSCT
jgi:hypothetical protein